MKWALIMILMRIYTRTTMVHAQKYQHQLEDQQQQPQPTQHINVSSSRKKQELSLETRRKLIDELLTLEIHGKLSWGVKRKISKKINIYKMTLGRL